MNFKQTLWSLANFRCTEMCYIRLGSVATRSALWRILSSTAELNFPVFQDFSVLRTLEHLGEQIPLWASFPVERNPRYLIVQHFFAEYFLLDAVSYIVQLHITVLPNQDIRVRVKGCLTPMHLKPCPICLYYCPSRVSFQTLLESKWHCHKLGTKISFKFFLK